MQMLREPVDSRVLRALKTLLLLRIILITPDRKAVRKTREVLVIVLDAQLGDLSITVLLEFRREHLVRLGSEDLHRDADGADFLLCEQRRVGGADGVDVVVALCAELEDGPAAVAVAYGADFFVRLLDCLEDGLHFWVADVFIVAPDELHDVEFFALGWVFEGFGLYYFAAEEAARVDVVSGVWLLWLWWDGGDSLGEVDGRICLFCKVVGQKTQVG